MGDWLLIFMFAGQPQASAGRDLGDCLYQAKVQDERQQKAGTAFKAYCWNPRTLERRYPRRDEGKRDSSEG